MPVEGGTCSDSAMTRQTEGQRSSKKQSSYSTQLHKNTILTYRKYGKCMRMIILWLDLFFHLRQLPPNNNTIQNDSYKFSLAEVLKDFKKTLENYLVGQSANVQLLEFSGAPMRVLTTFKLTIIIMFGKYLRVITKQPLKGLFRRNVFYLYNEVPKFDPSKDYYSILQVTKDSSESEIKKAYYRLAKSYHPDSNPGKENKFKEINEAYSVLSDPNIKKQYNSARSFQGFSRKMGAKAKEGQYDYQEYRNMYSNLSPEEQAEILEQTKKRIRNILYFGIAMLVILPFLVRKNHRFYVIDQGELVPVEFEGGMGQGMLPPPGMMNPYGQAPYPGQQAYQQAPPYGQQFNRPPPAGMYQNPPQQGYQSPYNAYQAPPPNAPTPYNNYRPQPGYAPNQ